MAWGTKLGSAGRDRGSWPVLLCLLVAVLLPTAGVLWFMNEAVNNQRDAARRKLAEAYRGQLALVRDGLDTFWEKRAAELDRLAASAPAPAIFEATVRTGAADSAICLGRDGALAYPLPLPTPATGAEQRTGRWAEASALESTPAGLAQAAAAYARIAAGEADPSVAGRAVQAQVRCLVQSGDKAAAARVIEQQFRGGRLAHALDLQGRLIAADAQLLAVHLKAGSAARRLQTMVNDYAVPMPSTQRLFLMEELRAVGAFDFPTYDAERLAAAFLAAERARPADPALRLSALPEVWKLASPAGRVIGLYRQPAVLAAMRRFLNEQNASREIVFTAVPPGAGNPAFDEWTPAGHTLPGWHITMALSGKPFDNIARRQMASYVWVGFLVIATMAVLATIAAQAFRRQMRLARLKTDLVAAVSHELKTPLTSMRVLVDALLDDARFDPQKTREYLELIARENLRLSRLIDNFLTFSRMERNRHKFEFTVTTAGEVVKAVEDALSDRFHAPQVTLDVQVSPALPAFRADPDALVTVLLNLLDNAYKFTPDEKRLALRAFEAGGRIAFSVEDNGIGIPAREQKRIFRRFYQVERRLSRTVGGCGLGLSIVEFIVRAHGGQVSVESRPGQGSTFTVALPAAAKGAAA